MPQRMPNRWFPRFPKLKNVEITFFQQKTSFYARKYEPKLPEKIPEFPLGSIYVWYKFQIFLLESQQMKK